MATDPTAPVTADDLRDLSAQAIRDSNGTPEALAWWEARPQMVPAHIYADAVLAIVTPKLERLRAELAATGRKIERLNAAYDRLASSAAEQRQRAEQAEIALNAHKTAAIEAIQRAEQAEAERDALNAATGGAMEIYRVHRQRHPAPLPDCITCALGLALSRDLPRTPDSREDVQDRLAALDARAALEFLYARQAHDGPGVRLDGGRCRGRSADALAWYGAGVRDEPHRDEYPRDRADLAACQRTVDMAPSHIAERMRPVLDRYAAALDIPDTAPQTPEDT